MRFNLTLLFTIIAFAAFSQWTIYPIPRRGQTSVSAPKKTKDAGFKKISYNTARLDSVIGPNGDSIVAPVNDSIPYLAPKLLPFWDDFSSSNNPDYPDTSKWRYGKSVSWNFGVGINPPTLGVVSFNGLDSLGSPYDVTNLLAKGYGDRLTSWTFNLDTIPADQRDSVYLSFYFEYQGNAEPPDPGDHLLVEFRRKTLSANDTTVQRWVSKGEIDVDSLLYSAHNSTTDSVPRSMSKFYPINIKVDSAYFFHDQFQFRISSFGRISGPWDTWIVDYVYLNTHRFQNDMSFPDRTVSTPLSSLFGQYWSIPARHFHADSTLKFTAPKFIISNLAQNQTGSQGQPIIYSTSIKIDEWDSTGMTTKQFDLDTNGNPGQAVDANEFRTVQLATLPSYNSFSKTSDSVVISLKASINSGDDIPFDPFTGKGDYQKKFIPIDFRVNDTTTSVQTLYNYYAYDDGSAEFAAGLNQPGTEVAYRFDMATTQSDFLVAVDLYFPNVGDESAQTFTLILRKDTTDDGVFYRELMQLQRSSQNKFIHHKLTRTLRVQDHFYIGYQQNNAGLIAVGLDQSNNTANKIIFNALGYWEADTVNLTGSLMIRPVFGAPGVNTGIDDEPVTLDVYPNPSGGAFYLSKTPDLMEIMDFTGRRISFVKESSGDQLRVTIPNAVPGIYLLKGSLNGRTVTRRIMVQR